MPSNEFNGVLSLLKSIPSEYELTFPEQRKNLEERTGKLPITEGVRLEPIEESGIKAVWFHPEKSERDIIVYYLHGGGYCLGSPVSHQSMISYLAKELSCSCLALDYRLAPEHPFPAAVDDVITGYNRLRLLFKDKKILIAGDSAGGGLAIFSMLEMKGKNIPLPDAAVCFSPWIDLDFESETYSAKREEDYLDYEWLKLCSRSYIASSKMKYTNPVKKDLAGLPPVLIQAGTAEMLLDDSLKFAEAAKNADVITELDIWPDMVHVFQFYAALIPESKAAIEKVIKFVDAHM